MEHYTTQTEQRNEIVTNDFESPADRHALRLSLKLGFPISHIRTALLANAAVKEN
jgi:hypothetical protein